MRLFLLALALMLSAGTAQAATYNYYFSNGPAGNPAGNDSTGDGTITTPWASLATAKLSLTGAAANQADTPTGTDIVSLNFDRGDIWTWNSADVTPVNNYFVVTAANPIVYFLDYGIGNKPKFDGLVTDFAAVPDDNTDDGPRRWNRFFDIQRSYCTFTNIEITGVYGNGIYINNGASYIDITYCDINNFGSASVQINTVYSSSNCSVEHSTIHTGQQLYKEEKKEAWGCGMSFSNNEGSGSVSEHRFRYNVVYDIFGEGVCVSNTLTEHNVIGDTCSAGIDPSTFLNDAGETIVRYNLITFSNYATSEYTVCPDVPGGSSGSRPVGTRVFDEHAGGDNSNGDYQIYGNIIINRWRGIWHLGGDDPGNPFGNVRVYGNIVIDSVVTNYRVSYPEEATSADWYNNASILYDRAEDTGSGGSIHINDDGFPDAGWNISNNSFWSNTGDLSSVSNNFKPNYVTGDPELYGESQAVDWTSIANPTAIKIADVTPLIGSALIGAGHSSYLPSLYVSPADMTGLPEGGDFTLGTQAAPGIIGAVLYEASTPVTSTYQLPIGLILGLGN